jgi:hypothetical protein
VVSKFSEYKKQVVRDIGFGGIPDLPCITKVNLRLSSCFLSLTRTRAHLYSLDQSEFGFTSVVQALSLGSPMEIWMLGL